MNLTLWEPMAELMDMHDELTKHFSRPLARRKIMPLDVVETKDALIFTANIPGAPKENIELNYDNDVLTIKANIPAAEYPQESRRHLGEIFHGEISRSIRVPIDVDVDQAEARYENGVLRLTLPKASSLKPKSITVK